MHMHHQPLLLCGDSLLEIDILSFMVWIKALLLILDISTLGE